VDPRPIDTVLPLDTKAMSFIPAG